MKLPEHGANPNQLIQALNLESTGNVIDFSVNTNPFGLPFDVNELNIKEAIIHYPDPHANQLLNCLSSTIKVDSESILLGNGAAECIFLIANFFRGKRICIVEPTFSEYRLAAEAFGCIVDCYLLKEENEWQIPVNDIEQTFIDNDVIFICHPNNPTGIAYPFETWKKLLLFAKQYNTMIVIDEAFYNFSDEDVSVLPLIHQFDHVIVLRSLTKMYQIPGARLGYMIAHPELIKKLKKLQPPWSINGIAQIIGEKCLQQDEFVQSTKSYIANERRRLNTILQQEGFIISHSSVNYYLLRTKTKQDLYPLLTYLIKNNLTARHTYNFRSLEGHYLRLAIRKRKENDQLIALLKGWNGRC